MKQLHIYLMFVIFYTTAIREQQIAPSRANKPNRSIANHFWSPWKWNGQEHNFGALNVLALPFLVLRGHYWCCWISDQRGSGGERFDEKISCLYFRVRLRKFCGFCEKQNIPAFTFGSMPSSQSWHLNFSQFCGDLDLEKFLFGVFVSKIVYLYLLAPHVL